jgi:hypothetical protein
MGLKKTLWDGDLLNWQHRSGTKIHPPIKEEKMNMNRLFASLVALALFVLAILTVGPNIATSAAVPSGQDLSNNALPHPGTVVERYFPGKAQDDLVTAAVAIDRHFPGKENDDIVAPVSAMGPQFPGKALDDLVVAGIAIGNRFPGKAQDDLVTAGVAMDNRYPGKAQDDLFVSKPIDVWHTPAYQGYTP